MNRFDYQNYRGHRGSQFGKYPPNKYAVRRRRWRAFFNFLIIVLGVLLIILLGSAI